MDAGAVAEQLGRLVTQVIQHRGGDVDALGAAQRGEGVVGPPDRPICRVERVQRPVGAGQVRVNGAAYAATRVQMQRQKVFSLPEEPLRNACVADMSVADNMALRDFDRPPLCRQGWRIDRRAIADQAQQMIAAFNVKPALPQRAIGTLSGGNVQRAVLARELAESVTLLIAANPVFGLDFAAVADIHARILAVRAQGGAVLLVSEDLDELLELADRILVMEGGAIVFETPARDANRATLGQYMAGHGMAEREQT